MHHEAETSIFLRVGELFTYSFALACIVWDEIYASFTTLKYSLVLIFEAMIPLLAWHRQRRKNTEKRGVERRKALGGSSTFSGSGTATDSESTAQSLRTPPSAALEGSSARSPKSSTAVAASGVRGVDVVKKKSFSAFHHKSPSSAQTPKCAEIREHQGKRMPSASSSSSVSESANSRQHATSAAAVDEGTFAQSLSSSTSSLVPAGASTSAAAVSRSTPLSIFSANHIKKAIRAHAGAVPNQMLWVPTGKNPPLWPTQRIVRGILRSQGVTKPKILAVDLDETLLCALPFSTKGSARYGKPTYHEAIPTASGAEIYAVWERPHVQLFLSAMARLYTVVVFTASVPFYADPFIDRLEGLTPNDYRPQSSSVTSRIHKPLRIRRRYYRDCCVPIASTPAATATAGVAVEEKRGTTASGIATQTLGNKDSPPAPTPAAGVGDKEETSMSSYALSGRSSPSSPLAAADSSLSLSVAANATASAAAVAAHNAGYEGDDTQSSAPPSASSTLGADQTAVARAELDKLIEANKPSAAASAIIIKPRQAAVKTANGGGGLENASFSSQASSASSRALHGPPRQHTDATKKLNHRQQSTQQQQRFAKDLSVFGVPLNSVVLLDNSLESFALFQNNGVLIDSYRPPLASTSSGVKGVAKAHPHAHHHHHHHQPHAPAPAPAPSDDALLSLIPFLEALYYVPDVRQVLSRRKKD